VIVAGGAVLGIVIVAFLATSPGATVNESVVVFPLVCDRVTRVGSLVDAVHEQGELLKVSVPLPPPEPKVKLAGDTEREEQLAAS
jgi:hypothetical protein